jgi:hypothetical protein
MSTEGPIMLRVLRGELVAFFAFDVGYEVSLEKLSTLFSVAPTQPLSRKRQTPAYLQFATPPITLQLETCHKDLLPKATLQATIFDFGAVSMAYRWSLSDTNGLALHQLASVGAEIYGKNMEMMARSDAILLLERIAPTIDRARLSDLVEDYYLYVIEDFEPTMTSAKLVNDYRRELAQALTFETCSLSDSQIQETLNQSVSYLENDVAIVDWNAAIIVDRDHEDTVRVLELLNVELLEAHVGPEC